MNRTLNIALLWITSAALLADLAFIGYLMLALPMDGRSPLWRGQLHYGRCQTSLSWCWCSPFQNVVVGNIPDELQYRLSLGVRPFGGMLL